MKLGQAILGVIVVGTLAAACGGGTGATKTVTVTTDSGASATTPNAASSCDAATAARETSDLKALAFLVGLLGYGHSVQEPLATLTNAKRAALIFDAQAHADAGCVPAKTIQGLAGHVHATILNW